LKRKKIKICPAADADLTSHALHIAQHASIEVALAFYDEADRIFDLLARQPRIGLLCEFTKPGLAHVRRFPLKEFRNYLVFYQPLSDGVEIVRILHGAQDIEAIMEADSVEG
jgi:toxin ParE1/3/4